LPLVSDLTRFCGPLDHHGERHPRAGCAAHRGRPARWGRMRPGRG